MPHRAVRLTLVAVVVAARRRGVLAATARSRRARRRRATSSRRPRRRPRRRPIGGTTEWRRRDRDVEGDRAGAVRRRTRSRWPTTSPTLRRGQDTSEVGEVTVAEVRDG